MFRSLGSHFNREWPTAIFVAALIGLIHGHVEWVDDIDVFAYVVAGDLSLVDGMTKSGSPGKEDPAEPRAIVFALDHDANQHRYVERTPLDRCELVDDIGAVYRWIHDHNKAILATARGAVETQDPAKSTHSGPNEPALFEPLQQQLNDDFNRRSSLDRLDVLVIDLDLSPPAEPTARDAFTEKQATCQRRLEGLLVGQARNVDDHDKVPSPASVEPGSPSVEVCAGTGAGARSGSTGPFPIRTILVDPGRRWPGDGNGQAWRECMERQGVFFGSSKIHLDTGTVVRQTCDPFSLAGVAFRLVRGTGNACLEETLETMKRKCKIGLDCAAMADRRQLIDPYAYQRLTDSQPISTLRANGAHGDAVPATESLLRNYSAVFFGVTFGRDHHQTSFGDIYGVEVHAASLVSLLDRPTRTDHRLSLLVDVLFSLFFGIFISSAWRGYFTAALPGPDERWYAGAWIIALACAFAVATVIAIALSAWLLRRWGIWSSPVPVAVGMLFEGSVLGIIDHVKHAANPPHHLGFGRSVHAFFVEPIIALGRNKRSPKAIVQILSLLTWLCVLVAALFIH